MSVGPTCRWEEWGAPVRATRVLAYRFPSICVVSIFLFVLCCTGISAGSRQERRVVKLPVVEGTDLRFAHVSFGGSRSYGRISAINEDDQGFLWFGTNNGLERYDGYQVREFRHDPGNPKSLSGSYINTLFKDRSGKLWVASDEFLERYDSATESFTRDPSTSGGIEGWVWHISQDDAGMLWLATHAGLAQLDPATWQTVLYKHRPGDPTSLSSDVVTATFEQSDGTFWVATAEGLDVFDRRTAKVTQHFPLPPHPPVSLQVESVASFFEDHANVLWVIYSFGNGLARVDRRNHKLIEFSPAGDAGVGTQLSGVRAIQEDADGALWLGTAGAGIVKLDRERRGFVRYRNDPGFADSLSSDQIVALFADRDHNIWVGSTGGGLDRFTYPKLPFHTYRHERFNPNSLESDYTSAVLEDGQGNLWVGSARVLTRVDRKTGHFTFYGRAGLPGGLSSTWVVSMAEDRSGYLWFGTLGGGLDRYDRRSGLFKVYRHNPADAYSPDAYSLSHDNVLALFVDHKGTLWAGTEDGISAFDPASGHFRVYRPQEPAWFRRYRAIAEDARGALWLGSLGGGLQRLDPATGDFSIYGESAGLSSAQVNAVCVDRSGTVWAGTQNGLDGFDPVTKKFTAYYERDGLPGDSVNSILEDGRGDLWLSTSDGLSRFNPLTKTFSNYYTSDGLLGNEFYNYANAYRSPTGEMFFNSYAGVIAFFPNQMVERPRIPPVVLTNFLLFGRPVPVGSGSPLKESISLIKSITLSHTQDIFSLQFSALSFADPERSRYRYKLEGLETGWNETDSIHRSATYTTLGPGTYTFRVQGRANRGPWNENGASLRILVLPPWWRTWRFMTACAALILFSLSAAYKFRLRRLAWQFNMRLEERVGERTRIARELHDTLLQSFQGLLLLFQSARNFLPERPAEAARSLDDALLRADQAITEGRDAIHGLRSSAVVDTDLEKAMTALGEELATSNGKQNPTSFGVLVEGAPQSLDPIVRDEIYRIAREALRNAFHYAQARRIETEITYGELLLRLRIRDDGSGIEPAVLGRGSRAGHWGLPGMRERAQRIGAQLNVWSQPGAGTEIELSIPGSIAYKPASPRAGFRLLRRKRTAHL